MDKKDKELKFVAHIKSIGTHHTNEYKRIETKREAKSQSKK